MLMNEWMASDSAISSQVESTDCGTSKLLCFIQNHLKILGSGHDVRKTQYQQSMAMDYLTNCEEHICIQALRRLSPLSFIVYVTLSCMLSQRGSASWEDQWRPRFESWFYYPVARWFEENCIIFLWDSLNLKVRLL